MEETRLTDEEYEALSMEDRKAYDDWVSEAPLRRVESGEALEAHLDYRSHFDHPDSW